MACIENVPPERVDSEMEEGEIVDDLDDLSDISSEEEFLLRQRLQVLENYNNVLERKKTKAKHTSSRTGNKRHKLSLNDLSEISGTEFDDSSTITPKQGVIVACATLNKDKYGLSNNFAQATPKQNIKVYRYNKKLRPFKPQEKQSKKEPEILTLTNNYEIKKKIYKKKRSEVKVIPINSDSEESEDEYRNKRRKLANAVAINKGKSDTSSLQARLNKMLYGLNKSEPNRTINQKIAIEKQTTAVKDACCSPIKFNAMNSGNEDIIIIESTDIKNDIYVDKEKENKSKVLESIDLISIKNCAENDINVDEVQDNKYKIIESIDLSSGDDVAVNVIVNNPAENCSHGLDTVDCGSKEITENICKVIKEDENSDDDLELLRQHALETKSSKKTSITIDPQQVKSQKPQSEDEDSDTAELRLICLKSALLKKAIEMKQKQKIKKRLSQSVTQDGFSLEDHDLCENIKSDNNTDIESMDMDMGSDGDEKIKDSDTNKNRIEYDKSAIAMKAPIVNTDTKSKINKEEELDEDEDLLRAKLLTSLSKNLPNLVDPTILHAFEKSPVKKKTEQIKATKKIIHKPEKRIIINVGDSDSEGEHEATKNLTKMHLQLSEQIDFQQKLDMFLKSARMEVEKVKLPDVVQQPLAPKTPQKFVAKAVDHLPESEQLEYKNLVKRMAELEKIKQVRQVSMNLTNDAQKNKDILPTNVSTRSTTVNNTDEHISMSRKKIAEESARMMKLKEEATKLSQKYKIVATELKNISTAITLNKKEQRSAQSRLAKIRMQHQRLLNSSSSRHSKFINNHIIRMPASKIQPNKTKNVNAPFKDEFKNSEAQKSLTISVANDVSEKGAAPEAAPVTRLSVELDVSSDKKTIKSGPKIDQSSDTKKGFKENSSLPEINGHCNEKRKDDYKSPLQALGEGTWEADPNAILCPFEVGGHCKDADCKYLHPKPSSLH